VPPGSLGLAVRRLVMQGECSAAQLARRRFGAVRPAGRPAQRFPAGETMATHKAGSRPPVGIREVARIAGVSVATASLALNGRPGVADETRRRAVAAAKQLGYRANPQAQALRRGRTTTYGFVVRNFANPFFLEVLSGAQQVAAESGATLLVLDSRYSIEREAVTLASHTSGESGPLTGTVIATTFLGATSRMTVDLGDVTILAQLSTSDATALPAGSQVALSIRPDPVLVAADSPTASEG